MHCTPVSSVLSSSLVRLAQLLISVLLMFVSGLPLQEVPTAKKRYEKSLNWDAYREYLRRTSIIYPIPPIVYAPMPTFLKRTLFLEFPMYVFTPMEDGSDVRNDEVASPRGSGTGLTVKGDSQDEE
jgi:hypothetical protein